jgi:hypothetical protein
VFEPSGKKYGAPNRDGGKRRRTSDARYQITPGVCCHLSENKINQNKIM